MNKNTEKNVDFVVTLVIGVVLAICVFMVLYSELTKDNKNIKITPPDEPKIILEVKKFTPTPLNKIFLFKNNGEKTRDIIFPWETARFVSPRPEFEKIEDVIYEYYEFDWEPPVFDLEELVLQGAEKIC